MIDTKKEIKKYLNYYHTAFGEQLKENEAQIISQQTPHRATLFSIGCGPAIIESHLQHLHNDITIISIDHNIDMLGIVPPNLHPILADGNNIPLTSHSIDVIICITNLEFINHPDQVLEEIYTVLRQYGLFLALLLNPYSSYVQAKRKNHHSYIGTHLHTTHYSEIYQKITQLFSYMTTQFILAEKQGNLIQQATKETARLILLKAVS